MSNGKPRVIDNETLESVVGGFNERSGGAGDDTLVGGEGGDKLMGSSTWSGDQPVNSGNDVLVGGGGADELHGGDGDDHLRGGTGHGDKVFGGDGNDTLWWRAGDGNDELHGGNGSDNVVVEGLSLQQVTAGLQLYQGSYSVVGNAIVFDGSANGQFTVNGETVRFFGVEQLTMPDTGVAPSAPTQPAPTTPPASPGGSVITGTAGADNLAGSNTWGAGSDGSWQPTGSGENQFNAGAGNDQAHGGDGNDTFRMGTGDDKAFGGDGNDVFYWSPGEGNDEFHGGSGQDSVLIEGTPFSSISSGNIMMYEGGSYSFQGNSIVFNGPSNGQITIGGQVVKFFGMERINFTNS